MKQELTFYKVSQVNEYIKVLFDNTITLKNIAIKGEISNFKGANKSGHFYFALKDEKSSISAVLFKFDSFGIDFIPKNGDEVIAVGNISSYPVNGTYQLICKKIMLFGKGEQLLKREQLKNKLFSEGYFNSEHKKSLPRYPNAIAVITGKNSAAAMDFEYNLLRRFPLVKIIHYDAIVQGENAPKNLIECIKKASTIKPDLIIIGRGGGSVEDLSAFDDEKLVKEVYECEIPIISAIGHEINQTFVDLAADKYASTPTGACEIAVPSIDEILTDLNQIDCYAKTLIRSRINQEEVRIKVYKTSKYFKNIENIFGVVDERLKHYSKIFNSFINSKIDIYSEKVSSYKNNLGNLNPYSILKKGYSILLDDNMKPINEDMIKEENIVNIRTLSKTIKAQVKEIKNE